MNIIERFLGFLGTVNCIECGVEGEALCVSCRANYVQSAVSSCYRCNAVTVEFETCKICRRSSSLSAVFVASEYDQSVKKLIHMYKFSPARHCSTPLVGLIEESFPHMTGSDVEVIPVPTASSHVRQRGFDHAVLLANNLAKVWGVSFSQLLIRNNNVRQVGASRALRLAQVQDSFRLKPYARCSGKVVCLVDDVLTTGATLEAAAKILKKAGAKRVIGVVVARS